jgi:hypothetical protein
MSFLNLHHLPLPVVFAQLALVLCATLAQAASVKFIAFEVIAAHGALEKPLCRFLDLFALDIKAHVQYPI